ncbi:CBF/Mak21 family-domain containing protein [Nitzschia inconspicua]|uniref:CBF/Mak21 family-domain containing protein n=1 Tax=Nitzschia inconspicua TaxID=303405 RepID=A0A9K3LEV1_9STRA|nr:CBF/Mak21 family-domain containing protein [Nitzschia inconspicua]
MGKPDQLRRRGRSKDKRKGELPSDKLSLKGDVAVSNVKAPLINLSAEATTWYNYGQDLTGRNDTIASLPFKERNGMTPELIRRFRSTADAIYQNELRLFSQSQDSKSSSDEKWVENTMRKGTLKDRIAAMSVTISNDPIHKLYALDGLLSMVGCSATTDGGHGGKPNSRVAQLAGEALEDIFVNTLLPSDRKLLTMGQRPLCRYDINNSIDDNKKDNKEAKNSSKQNKSSHKMLSPRILLLWRFEEMVKEKYDLFLRQYMAQTLHDGLEQQKIATLQSAANLLTSVPEGEAKLLDMMVNKLGDPDKKTAAAAGHQLRIVLQRHPNMQTVIAREVQQLAHRPHLAPKALYNCIVFLNQLQLKRPEIETGIVDHDQNKSRDQSSSLPASLIKTYFRLFEVAVKQNEKQSKNSKTSTTSDDAGAMKGRLLSALLTGVNRAHPYLPEKDQDMEEHIDALFRIVHKAPPGACTQALMLLFHLAVGFQLEKDQKDDDEENRDNNPIGYNSEERQKRQDRFYRALYATLQKSNVVCRGKHLTMYFNLLYKAMKYDTDINRVHAFVKRLLAAVLHAPPPTMAATMFLLQEISRTHQDLRLSWEDVPDPDSNASLVLDDTKREPKAGIVNMTQLLNEGSNGEMESSTSTRGPPPYWELALLSHHFHPSVNKFANDIGEIDYAGDPLHDFGLAPFLDKFAYRNPKSREKLLQQYKQKAGTCTASKGRRMKRLEARLELPLNDPRFLEKNDISEQDEFFHRFFVERARRDEIKGIARSTAEASNENDDDEDEEMDAQELEALEAAEEADADVGVKSFEEYEATWDTDEEEEAFVDSLAMKLLEDSAGGPADIDDDPDMEDWGDMYDDGQHDDEENDDDDDANQNEDYRDGHDSGSDDTSNSSEAPTRIKKNKSYNGAFFEDDAMADESDSEDSDSEPLISESEIVGTLNAEALDQESVEEDDDKFQASSDGSSSSTDNDDDEEKNFLSLIEEDSDDDDDEQAAAKEKTKKKSYKTEPKNQDVSEAFVDADEYAEMIEKSFRELKLPRLSMLPLMKLK